MSLILLLQVSYQGIPVSFHESAINPVWNIKEVPTRVKERRAKDSVQTLRFVRLKDVKELASTSRSSSMAFLLRVTTTEACLAPIV